MTRAYIPQSLKPLCGGTSFVDIEARTVRGLIERLDEAFPGIADRLRDGDGLKSGLAVSVDGRVAPLGLYQKIEDAAEVHFVLAIGGG